MGSRCACGRERSRPVEYGLEACPCGLWYDVLASLDVRSVSDIGQQIVTSNCDSALSNCDSALSKITSEVPTAIWAKRICIQAGKTVESIIEIGRLFAKAKADLPYGEWGRLFEGGLVPFSIDSAQRLMAIADHPQIANTSTSRYLPPAWTTLYELTRVEPKRLTAAFAEGLVNPDMTGNDAKKLRKQPRKTRQKSLEMTPKTEPSEAAFPYLEMEKLLKRYLDNHCANADAEGMSTLCECKLCIDTRVLLMMEVHNA